MRPDTVANIRLGWKNTVRTKPSLSIDEEKKRFNGVDTKKMKMTTKTRQ